MNTIKVITSITVFNDAVGLRLSATYSEVDESGKVISDNKRFDRVVTDSSIKAKVQEIFDYAVEIVEG